MKGKLKIFICLAGFLAALPLGGEEISWTRTINWEKGELSLVLSTMIDTEGPNRPAASVGAERRLDAALSRIFPEAFLPLLIDSTTSFGDAAEQGVFPAAELASLSRRHTRGIPRFSTDIRSLSISYTYLLHDILGGYFVRHTRPREIPRHLAWVPTREYTGIIIYARGELPVHGEYEDRRIAPCLFPKIFDDDMNPVFITAMGDPEYLSRWGNAAYTSSFNEAPWRHRIGERPLHILASGLYGKYPTDIKISAEDAASILASPENRRLLAEGRVLIITGE